MILLHVPSFKCCSISDSTDAMACTSPLGDHMRRGRRDITHEFTIVESWIFLLVPPKFCKITFFGFLKVNSVYNCLQWFLDCGDGEHNIVEKR